MSIKYAILGFLSWQPATGYDLKKLFADSEILYWSGNSNQIYRALVGLHKDGLVTKEVEHQESLPSRKIYTITDAGLVELKQWVQTQPELPQLKNSFHVQLAWADQLSDAELDKLLAAYEEEIDVKHKMMQEQERRNTYPQRNPRETYIWTKIADNWASFYERELVWVRELRQTLGDPKLNVDFSE